MIFTSEMNHVTVVVSRDHAEAVSKCLLALGAVQFNRLSDIAPSFASAIRPASVESERSRLIETRRRIEGLLTMGGVAVPTATSLSAPPTDTGSNGIDQKLDRLVRDVEQFRKKQAELQQEINRVTDVQRQLASLGSDASGAAARAIGDRQHRYLDMSYGSLKSSELDAVDRQIGRYAGLLMPLSSEGDTTSVLVVAMKRNAADVRKVLDEHGFREGKLSAAPDDAGDEAIAEADARLRRLRAEQGEQSRHIEVVIGSHREELESDWRTVRLGELLLSIRGTSSESSHAAVFTGWVPKRQRSRVETDVREAANEACLIEWHTASEMKKETGNSAPVELQNPRFLRPFQMLVTNYGIPEYGTIDPTPLVAVAYLLMFGLMFGDAGHGLVLVILGLIGMRILQTPGMKQLSRLLVWCGGASMVMGVLFGAYFGFELLPPLWFNYHGVVAGHAQEGAISNLMDILTLTVYLGIAVIAIGLVLNWINNIRKRDWRVLIFEKTGILGGIMYGTGVWLAAAFARSGFRSLPSLNVAGLLIVVPALLLFLKFPLQHRAAVRRGEHPHGGPVMWVMDWVIEIVDVFSGYLANTLSFMRVAGLGIAHVMLMVAFFQISQMVSPGGTSVLSVVVLLAGNALVIALEGLSAGIQSLRLNYYEFFSKYFTPTGTEFRPITLDQSL